MKIVEEFISIQGEGIFSGKYAYFIRFAGCNFNCKGFNNTRQIDGKTLQGCDTLRAVYTKEFKDTYKEFNLCILKDKLKALAIKPIIVLTGGEPLIHQKNSEFIELLEYLTQNDYCVQFETNASIKLMDFDFYKKCYFAMGIKLENSAITKDLRINHEAIKSILNGSKKAFFKIVLSQNDIENDKLADLKELRNIYKDEDFYLMPMGATNAELSTNAKSVIEYAINNGFNYTDRLHIRIYDDKEGV